ncbi:MAG: hypothetical protein LBV07_04975 [Syntrophobacterales bacterium]|jgi:hypothetical protein|nr:hypothetical protein [Syntrophobacterales bacterium]
MKFTKHYQTLERLLGTAAKELEGAIDSKALKEALGYLEDGEYGLSYECLLAGLKKRGLPVPASLAKAAKKMDIS